MKYSRIVAEFYRRVWALKEETLISMRDLIRQQSAGVKWSLEEIRERIDASNLASGYVEHESFEARYLCFDQGRDLSQPMLVNSTSAVKGGRSRAAPGSVAVIPMTGIISHRMSMMSEISGGGGGSTQALTAQFRQALGDGNCKAIVFDVDSAGGSVEGVMELASEIYNGRKVKPITAVFNARGCSAAYWLASASSELVCTPSGQCGSIGVYMLLQDESEALKNEGVKITMLKAGKYKAEGHPSQPLTDEARDFLQGQVDSVYSLFVKAVAQQRGVSQGSVREGMGQGRSLLAADSIKAGLADRVGTLDSVLARLLGRHAIAASETPLSLSLAHRSRQLALGCTTTTLNVPDYKQTLERRRRELELVAGVMRPS
jgi:signal peptide peptidase SppA